MKRIRLLVQVQPWQRANESGVETPLQEKILPWTEPCLDTTLISELAERIAARFEAIHSDKGQVTRHSAHDFRAQWFADCSVCI